MKFGALVSADPNKPATPNEPNVPAGWYPDGQGSQRWWDGTQWTEHVHLDPAAQAAQFEPTAQPPSQAHGSRDHAHRGGRRGHALTSPLIAEITKNLEEPTKAQAIDNLMYTAATGMSYMCAADADGWFETLDKIGGDW